MRSCSIRVIELNQKMLNITRFVTKNDFFHVRIKKTDVEYLLKMEKIILNRWSLPRKSLISRMDWVSCAEDINLPHKSFPPARPLPNKKIKYNKILTYILRSIFLEIPHLELPRWWKTPRDTNGKGV
jgi:hypothetical protein